MISIFCPKKNQYSERWNTKKGAQLHKWEELTVRNTRYKILSWYTQSLQVVFSHVYSFIWNFLFQLLCTITIEHLNPHRGVCLLSISTIHNFLISDSSRPEGSPFQKKCFPTERTVKMQTMWIETALSTYSLRLIANRKLEGEEKKMRKKNKKTVRFISGHCI